MKARPHDSAIFREPTPAEAELLRLKDELARTRKELATRERALHDLRSKLLSFEGRYIRQVGLLYKQLDEWEQRIAELHATSSSVDADGIESAEDVYLPDDAVSSEPIDLKALYRELAKRIHPDFATDMHDERRRTRLMAQANDALKRKDHGVLQRMLNGFEAPADSSSQQAIEAEILDTQILLQQVEQDIQAADAEIAELSASELANLQRRTIEAAVESRDLLAEMAARVKGRIGLAMRQYELDVDRKKRPRKGPSVETLVTAETHREPRYDAKRGKWIRE